MDTLNNYSPVSKIKTNTPNIETDPYEAHLFDDPDEYADYYAEEFAEEIEENMDEGYMDSYDHWIEWHEK